MGDFESDSSAQSDLTRFQIYKLKIDQLLLRDLKEDANDRAIVSSIIRMAQALGMQTTAEGVEADCQLKFPLEQGCDERQGYLFSCPLPAEALETHLRMRLGGYKPAPAAQAATSPRRRNPEVGL